MNKLYELLFTYLTEINGLGKKKAAELIIDDIVVVPNRRIPNFLKNYSTGIEMVSGDRLSNKNKRQIKHK